MPNDRYRIQKAFIIPLGIDTLLLFVLLVLSFAVNGAPVERAVLTILFVAALFVFLEATRRFVAISDEALKIGKFFKVRSLAWTEVTHVGCLILRSRVYLLLTTTRGFYILSNTYERFSSLVRDLIAHLPSENIEVEEQARAQADHPTRNLSNAIAAWFAAAVLIGIVYLKLTS